MVTLKELPKEELYASGHRLCAGCGEGIINRMTLKALRGPTIIVQATGCTEVASTIYPYTAWQVSFASASQFRIIGNRTCSYMVYRTPI